MQFLTLGDLFWLRDYLLLKAHGNSVCLIYHFTLFHKNSKFDLSLEFLTSGDLATFFFWKFDANSGFLIYKFSTLRKIWNITPDRFVQIFYSFSLIILSYYLAKFDQFVIFTKFVIFIKFEKMAANTRETSCQ